MTNQAILSAIYSYTKNLPEYEKNTFDAMVKSKTIFKHNDLCFLADVVLKINEEERTKAAKKSGKGELDRVIKKFVKEKQNVQPGCIAAPCEMGFSFTNGFVAVATNDNMGYECGGTPFEFDKIYDPIVRDNHHVQKIDMVELRLAVKTAKAQKQDKPRIKYQITDTLTYAFNPVYLLDLLTACNTDELCVNDYVGCGEKYGMRPAYAKNDNVCGIICPIRLKD